MSMSKRKIAFLTGCSDPSSLGAAMALDLLGRGWTVYASAIDQDTMSDLGRAGCIIIPLDVTSDSDIKAASVKVGDRLDLLVNNAAVEGLGPLLDIDPDRLLGMYRTNVFGPLFLTQALADALINSKGCVVNIGSVGVYGLPFHGVYASSKAAFQVLSDVLRRETAPLGLRVVTVELGMVMTAMLRYENPYNVTVPESRKSSFFHKWYSDIAPRYRKDIEARIPKAMSAQTAAEQIVNAVEKGSNGKLWVGTMAWIFRWLWPYLSTARQDKINGDLLHVNMLRP